MNLNEGEKLVKVVIASSAFGEINPGQMELRQVELVIKKDRTGNMAAEMIFGYKEGAAVYNFQNIDHEGLVVIRNTLDAYARAANQPGVFREYNFDDCRDEEEMRFRFLLIPEYRAAARLPKDKVISLETARESLKCPVCGSQVVLSRSKCPECGAFTYRDGGRRYFESERASYFPLRRNGNQEPIIHLCKIDFINIKSGYIYPHITYVEEMPVYLGAVYTFTPPAAPVEFSVILNKPSHLHITQDILSAPYRCRRVSINDLDILKQYGTVVFRGTGTEPFLVVSFRVWDYTCLEEIGSHVNFILYKYNSLLDEKEGLS